MTSLTPQQLEWNRGVIAEDIVKDVPVVNDVAQFLLSKMYKNNAEVKPDSSANSFDENASNMLVEVGQELAKCAHTTVRRPRDNDNTNNASDAADAQAQPEEKSISEELAAGAVAAILVLNFDSATSAVDIDAFGADISGLFVAKKNNRQLGSVVQWIETLELLHQDLNIAIRDAINNNKKNNNNVIAGDNGINLRNIWTFYSGKLLLTSPYIKNRPLPPPTLITIFDAIAARHRITFKRNSDFSEALNGIGVKVAISSSDEDSLLNRFIRPAGAGKLLPVPLHLELRPNELNPSFESSKNNVIVGFSGAGKTIAPFIQAATWNEADISNPNVGKGFVVYSVANGEYYAELFATNSQHTVDRNLLAVKYLVETIFCAFPGRDVPIFPCIKKPTIKKVIASLDKVDKNNNNGISIADSLRAACASSIPNSNLQKESRLHRLYIALDEMGPCPLLASGLCAVWNDVRVWLAREIFLMDPDKLFLVTIGTGVKSTFDEPASTFAVFTVNNCCLFREHLRSLASADTTTAEGKQLIERFDTALFEPVPDDYQAGAMLQDRSIFFSVPLLDTIANNNNNNHKNPVPYRIRVIDADITRYRFAQVVTFNARTASIAAACLHLAVSNNDIDVTKIHQKLVQEAKIEFSSCASRLRLLLQDPSANASTFNIALGNFARSVIFAFKELNALNGSDAMVQIADALRVALSRTSELNNEQYGRFCTRYGLLRQLPDKSFEMSPSFAAMYLLRKNLISAEMIGASDLFKHMVAEHHALVPLLDFPTWNAKRKNKFITMFRKVPAVGNASIESLADCLADCGSGYVRFLQQADEHRTNSWRSRILRNEVVVLVNGPTDSFADVIVLARDRIFLTQCNYYEPNSICDASTEFAKMHTDNPTTMKLLIECCRVENRTVPVICSIVFKYQDQQNVAPAYELVKERRLYNQDVDFSEHFLYVFPFAESEAPGRSWSESNMFPVLVAPFEPQLE